MSGMKTCVVLGIFVALWGCDHHDAEGDHEGHGSHDGHEQPLALKLNNGEKWAVDDHTRQTATRITEVVAASGELNSADEARSLAARLDEELNLLVQGCTMTGPAHDQLHVFLVALFPKVAVLKEAEDVEHLQKTRDEINELLAAYAEHFK